MLTVPADGGNGSATVKIVNNMEEPLEVFAPVVNNPAFKADLITNTHDPVVQKAIEVMPEASRLLER